MASLVPDSANDGHDSLNTVPSSLSAYELLTDRRMMPDPALLAGVEISETGDAGYEIVLPSDLFGAAVYNLVLPGKGLPTTVLSLSDSLFKPKVVASWSSIIVLSFLPRACRVGASYVVVGR